MFTRPWRRAAVAAALVAVTLSACANPGGGSVAGAPTFKLATSTWIGFGPWNIAAKKGFFAKHGINVEITSIEDSPSEFAAVSSGKVDGANFATNVWLNQLAQGTKLDLVMLEDRSTTADAFLGGPGITSVRNLAGKSVAYEGGSTSDLLFQTACANAGVDAASIKHVELPAAQAGSALIAGQVDGAVTYEPYVSTALAQGKGISAIYTAGQQPGIVSDGLVVNPDYAKANPKVVIALTQAWDDAVAFLGTNPDEGRQIIADALGAQLKDLTSAFNGVTFYSRQQSAQALNGDFLATTIPMIVKGMTAAGTIKQAPDYRPHVTAQYVTG